MTLEWLKFQAYIKKPTYCAASKHDLSYLGRFTFKTITDFEGFGRILTVIASGYLFHNQDGSLRADNPYERVEYVRNALCAWCSIPRLAAERCIDVNLKARNMLCWVAEMNNIKASAEEIVLREVVYQ